MIELALKKKRVKQIMIVNQIKNVVKIHVEFQNATEQHPPLWKLQVKETLFSQKQTVADVLQNKCS